MRVLVGLSLVFAGTPGCAEDDLSVPATCAEASEVAEACGGDPVGRWEPLVHCLLVDEQLWFPGCDEALSYAEVDGDVELALRSDGALEHTGMGRLERRFERVPEACLDAGTTCRQEPTFSWDEASVAEGVCTRELVSGELDEQPTTRLLEFSVEDEVLLIRSGEGDEPSENDYCVRGDVMVISSQIGDGVDRSWWRRR